MKKKEINKLFEEEFRKITVSEELKRKTLEKINKNQNVLHIPYLRNICAIFIVSLICFAVYYKNKPEKSLVQAQDNMSIESNLEIEKEMLKNRVVTGQEVSSEKSYLKSAPAAINKSEISVSKDVYYGEILLTDDFSEQLEEKAINFNDEINSIQSEEILLESEFLIRYPDAQKMDNGYKILENGIEKIYVFEDGKLIKIIQ